MIICMAIATVLFILFTYLFLSADDGVLGALVVCNKETQLETIKSTEIEMTLLIESMKKANNMEDKKKINKGKKLKKKHSEAKKLYDVFDKGKYSVLDMIPLAGYRVMQILRWDATNDFVKKLLRKCQQFKERKEAMNYTYFIIASLIGNILLGVVVAFAGTGLGLGFGLGIRSLIVGVVCLGFFGLLGYLPYDNVNVVVNKRKEDIDRQFPQAISKMTLLTVAGMEVSQAWKLTAISGIGTLYEEMNRVLIDLEHNVSPSEAYQKFIAKCNNNYTTKLATAILQNISKGNSEIVALFTQLNDESWSEHKHSARRMSEKIQSKLMVPTMLMFAGILILIIVPVMSGFSF